MRVLFLAHVFPRTLDDSMGAFLLQLADALAARDIAVEVIAPHAPNLADEEMLGATRVRRFRYAPARWERLAYAGTMHEFVARGIVNKILFALFTLAFFVKTLAVVRAARPNILHAHWWLPGGLVGAFASLVTRAPLVVTTHGTDVEMLRRTRWARPLARFAFRRARVITCGSTYLREQLLELGVADAETIQVIPMPVRSGFQVANYELRITNLVLTVARLTKQKSIDTLIEAMAFAPNAHLKIIGDGPERAALEKQVDELGLRERIEFLGALPPAELPRHYATCAVFALPSIREGMGIVFAEALLCGAPIIAANSGGVTDIVRDGETGVLVPERDARALANAIEKLLNDRVLAQQLASNGAAWVRERFTRTRVAEQFEQIYQAGINGTR
ncbi:MAG: glycosyltransferase [Chloroflexi bacterium]|nr:glycosyltransferase [Chloroflexota bacterium]